MEFILVIPVLGVILALTFFFGWALLHKHQMVVADRYASWHRVETGTWPDPSDINRNCLGDRGQDVNLSGSSVVNQTPEDLVQEADGVSEGGGKLADELVIQRFEKGRRAVVTAQFPAHKSLWEAIIEDRPTFRSRHSREGITWRCDESRCWPTLRDEFYQELDEGLRAVPEPGDGMAQMIRSLYMTHWPDRTDEDGSGFSGSGSEVRH